MMTPALRLDVPTLAWRALSLDERRAAVSSLRSAAPGDAVSTRSTAAPTDVAAPAAAPSDAAQQRLARWCRAVAAGRTDAFLRRLAWEGLDAEGALALLDETPPDGFAVPPWTRVLERAVTHLADGSARSAVDALVESSIGDGGAGGGFFEAARQAAGGAEAISDRALGDCVECLRRDLEALASDLPADPEAFAARCHDAPVLARALVRTGERWRRACLELLERFADDRGLLAAEGEAAAAPGLRIERIDGGLSDAHDGGRRVAILHLLRGDGASLVVVYKPRPLAIEVAFQAWLTQLAEGGCAGALPRPLRVLDRGSYGWMERVEPASGPMDDAACRAYFRRAGGLLCLTTVLGADDLHAENVIASAEGPAIIDAETVMQPAFVPTSGRSALVGTQLLTSPQIDAAGRPYDLGGLRGRSPDPRAEPTNLLRSSDPSGASTALGPEDAAFSPEDTVLWPEDHAADLAEGYQEVYRALLATREAAAAPEGPLRALAGVPIRALYRSSDVYGSLLQKLAEPTYRSSGAAASILLEALARPIALGVATPEAPVAWELAASERQALLAGDVPVMRLAAGASRPEASLESIASQREDVIEAGSGLARVLAALDELSEAALEGELASLDRLLSQLRRERQSEAQARAVDRELLAAARQVAETLADRAEALGRSWLLPDSKIGSSVEGGAPTARSPHLYDGGLGVAVFLSQLAAATGEAALCQRAAACLEATEAALEEDAAANHRLDLGLGIGHGLGGWIFGAVRVAAAARQGRRVLSREVLSREVLSRDGRQVWAGHLEARAERLAERAAESLTARLEGPFATLDLSMGLAGGVVGLAALAARQPRWRETALAAGHRLLDGVGDPKRWTPGLAHGAGGVALALRRLESLDPQGSWSLAAGAFEAREASLYEPIAGGWPVDGDRRRGFATSWCHGAAGIGAGRLATVKTLGLGHLAASRSVIDSALAAVLSADAEAARLDHLCCGEAGRIDFLLDAADSLSRPALRRVAQKRAAGLAERLAAGTSRLDESVLAAGPSGAGGVAVGLFRGLSGLGWALLRAAVPGVGSLGGLWPAGEESGGAR